MARTGRELAIAKRPHLTAQGLLGDREAEFLPDPLHQIDQAPAHHAMDGRNGPLFDDGLQSRALGLVQDRPSTRGLAVDQPGGTVALKRSTQSRTICSVTQPIRAAAVRVAPS